MGFLGTNTGTEGRWFSYSAINLRRPRKGSLWQSPQDLTCTALNICQHLPEETSPICPICTAGAVASCHGFTADSKQVFCKTRPHVFGNKGSLRQKFCLFWHRGISHPATVVTWGHTVENIRSAGRQGMFLRVPRSLTLNLTQSLGNKQISTPLNVNQVTQVYPKRQEPSWELPASSTTVILLEVKSHL